MNTSNSGSYDSHALSRLGVNEKLINQDKGLRKLGICDDDITNEVEIRHHNGANVTSSAQEIRKKNNLTGYTEDQLKRDKAMKRLGTSEEQVMDDTSAKLGALGEH